MSSELPKYGSTFVVQTSNIGFTSEVSDYLVVHTGPGEKKKKKKNHGESENRTKVWCSGAFLNAMIASADETETDLHQFQFQLKLSS